MDLGDLMDELERDRVYMEESGGGISISGGEPLQQPEALFRLLELSRERSIHTTVDTSGFASSDEMEKTSGLANLILFDLKTMNEKKHLKYTGVSRSHILENLEMVQHGTADVIVRIPIVTGFNDTDEEMRLMLDFLKGIPGVEAIDLLPYHHYGIHKYKRFNRENRQNGFKTPTKQRIEEISKMFSDAGFMVRVGG